MSVQHPPARWAVPPAAYAATLIILVGVALRLYNLGVPSIWWDESVSLLFSEQPFRLLGLFDTRYMSEAPLFNVLVRAWRAAMETLAPLPRTHPGADYLLRLMPLLFGALAMPLFYLLAKRISGSAHAAIVATALMAVSPFQIHYAQELRVYSLHLLCALAAAYCTLRALEDNRTRWWAGMLTANVLLVYGHYISVWVIFSLSVYFLTQLPGKMPLLKKWTAWNAGMMVLIAPGLWHAWQCNQMMLAIEYPWYPNPTVKSVAITFKNLLYGYGPGPGAYHLLLALGISLAAYGGWKLRRNRSGLALVVCLLLVPVAANFLLWRARDFSMYEDRIFIASGAMLFILIGAGVAALSAAPLRGAALGVLMLLSLVGLGHYQAGRLHPVREHRLAICDKVDFRAAAAYLDNAWKDGDLLAHESNFTTLPMRWYFSGEQEHLGATPEDEMIYIKAMSFPDVLEALGALPVLADEATRNRDRVWYLEAFGVTADDQPQTEHMGDWLRQRYHATENVTFAGLNLTLFEGRK